LRDLQSEYTIAYENALAVKANTSDPHELDTAFDECKRLKALIRVKISKVRGVLFPFTPEQKEQVTIMEKRFNENPKRHRVVLKANIKWRDINRRLRANPSLIDSLIQMEESGGEPDIVWCNKEGEKYYAFDCSEESPEGRRDMCYDFTAEEWCYENEEGEGGLYNAEDMAERFGIEIMDALDYDHLQYLGDYLFDQNSSNWVRKYRDEDDQCESDEAVVISGQQGDGTCTKFVKTTEHLESRGFRGKLAI